MSQTSDIVRARFTEGDNIRDAGLTTPEDIRRYDDIPYGPDPQWQVLDVYRPRAAEGQKLPVIVSVHGGGWVYGDKERYQFYCMNLAQRGFAVVNFTYRLAPEFQFPAPLEDTNLVFTWVLTHGEVYGFDTGHVFGVGDSAGGHLLGLYADFCTIRATGPDSPSSRRRASPPPPSP
ncbi:MAG: alpha/beta hydrolase [Clostridiales bacterium]|nr:alpha/beta hydrolase [Clostridiales bacterium]